MPRLNGSVAPRNLPSPVLEALSDTIDYLWEIELEAYQEAYNDGLSEEELEGFEFENLVILNNWLYSKSEKATDFLLKEPVDRARTNQEPCKIDSCCRNDLDNCPPHPADSR